MTLPRLFALFIIVPIVELFLLLEVGRYIGVAATLGIIIGTGVIGGILARREGVSAWRRFNERMARGEIPGGELVDGLIILVAGALLMTPGVLTDVVGFLGLLPPTRSFVRRRILRRVQAKVAGGSIRFYAGGFNMGTPHRAEDPGDRKAAAWQGIGEAAPQYIRGDEEPDGRHPL